MFDTCAYLDARAPGGHGRAEAAPLTSVRPLQPSAAHQKRDKRVLIVAHLPICLMWKRTYVRSLGAYVDVNILGESARDSS